MTAPNLGGSGRWLGLEKAAAFLDMEPKTLKRHYRKWEIPYYYAGVEVRFRERDLNQWLLSRSGITNRRYSPAGKTAS